MDQGSGRIFIAVLTQFTVVGARKIRGTARCPLRVGQRHRAASAERLHHRRTRTLRPHIKERGRLPFGSHGGRDFRDGGVAERCRPPERAQRRRASRFGVSHAFRRSLGAYPYRVAVSVAFALILRWSPGVLAFDSTGVRSPYPSPCFSCVHAVQVFLSASVLVDTANIKGCGVRNAIFFAQWLTPHALRRSSPEIPSGSRSRAGRRPARP